MKKILVVVDMQNDFIDGVLGTPEAVAIVDNVVDKIRGEKWDLVYTTYDTHDKMYLYTQEGKSLPVEHCIEGTDGWMLNDKIYNVVVDGVSRWEASTKDTFGSVKFIEDLRNIYPYSINDEQDEIELTFVGVCTDICVISNALLLKAYCPEMNIIVDASCCAGSTPEKHKMALEVMKSCQINIINEYT